MGFSAASLFLPGKGKHPETCGQNACSRGILARLVVSSHYKKKVFVGRDWKHYIPRHANTLEYFQSAMTPSWYVKNIPTHNTVVGGLRARYVCPSRCSWCPQARPTVNRLRKARSDDLSLIYIIITRILTLTPVVFQNITLKTLFSRL